MSTKSAKHIECKKLVIQSRKFGQVYSGVFVKILVSMFKNPLLRHSRCSGHKAYTDLILIGPVAFLSLNLVSVK